MDTPDVRDAEEQSVDDFVQEVDLALMQMKSETLKKIDQAHPPAGGGHLRALPGLRRRDPVRPPARPALRRPLPRLPGGGRERRPRPARDEGLRAPSARAGERDPAGRRPRLRRPFERRAQAGLRVGRRPRRRPERASRPRSASCRSGTRFCSPRPSSPSRWPGRAPWRSSTTRCKERKVIGVVTQRDPSVDDPAESDLFGVGTLTHIHKMFRFPDGSLRLVVQGIQRFRILQVTQYRPVPEGAGRAHPRGGPGRAGDRGAGARPERAGPLPEGGGALPHPLRRARQPRRQHPGARSTSRTSSPGACPPSTPPRSRSSSRRSTCTPGSSA